jgi:hypothetical protein
MASPLAALWKGQASDVLAQWRSLAQQFDIPPDKALPDNDPRRPIQRGLTYLKNNLERVDCSWPHTRLFRCGAGQHITFRTTSPQAPSGLSILSLLIPGVRLCTDVPVRCCTTPRMEICKKSALVQN